jgi:hypothetical protein
MKEKFEDIKHVRRSRKTKKLLVIKKIKNDRKKKGKLDLYSLFFCHEKYLETTHEGV